MSGVSPSAECVPLYEELKLKKKLKYIIYKLNANNTEIVVEKKSESGDYDDFIADLPETECRWAVYDFEYEAPDGGKRNKLSFFAWCVIMTLSVLFASPNPLIEIVFPLALLPGDLAADTS